MGSGNVRQHWKIANHLQKDGMLAHCLELENTTTFVILYTL